MRKLVGFIFLSFILLVLIGCANDDSASGTDGVENGEIEANADGEVYELQLGHIATETNTYHLLAESFKEKVEERSDGRLQISIYPNAQLGGDRELVEALTFGNLDLAIVTSSPVMNFVPEFGVLDIPYLFEDWDQIETFVESDIVNDLMKETEEIGVTTYSIVPRGFRSVTTSNTPVETPEDMEGLTLRVIESEVYLDTIDAMGATATAMPWADAYTAMQQGAIDGQENDYPINYAQNVSEVQNHLSLTEHIFAFFNLMGSSTVIEQLPEDLQQIIEEAAVEASQENGQYNRAEEDNLRQLLEDQGMEINEVDKPAFIEATSDVREKYGEEYGSTYFEAIRELIE